MNSSSSIILIFSSSAFLIFTEVLDLSSSIMAKTLPFETLSPILTAIEEIFPSKGEGTSTLDYHFQE